MLSIYFFIFIFCYNFEKKIQKSACLKSDNDVDYS